jgi:aspartyl-tRNA(Asn)/glutamyl-tRNA(Gln) amidotransferase subunit C
MISKEEVKHIAKLARLGLTEKEIERFQKELSSILDYVEKLKKADISGVEAVSSAFKIENVVREDEKRKENLGNEKLVEMTPEIEKGYVKVKSIFQ